MSEIAALIADMVRAGVDPDLIGRTAQALSEREPVIVQRKSAGAERTARWRGRHKASQSVTSDDSDAPLSPAEVSPHTPLPTTPNPPPPSPPKGGSSPAPIGWPEFWAGYPHKVGKPDALKAYGRAIKRTDPGVILDGLRRYVAKTDDRPWCNPATWLNQDRWDDQPAEVAPRQRAGPPAKPMTALDVTKSLLRQMEATSEQPDRDPERDQFAAIGFSRHAQ